MSDRKFIASISYDVSPDASPQARKLLLAEMVGRRWLDRCAGNRLPANTLWIKRTANEDDTTRTIYKGCSLDLQKAVQAVRNTGRTLSVRRVWIQVSGAGTFGVVDAKDMD